MPINKATKPYTFVNGPGEFADAAEVNACFDTLYSKLNEMVDAINLAAGLKANLDARLDLTINEDGTARSGTTFGGEWINPALAATFVDASNFTVEGDQTSLFLQYRRLKITLAASTVYTEVSAVSYSGVSGLTTVTLADAVATAPITAVEHAAYSPQASGKHSISPNALTPTNALALNGQADTFYRNADNLNAGSLPAALFNDTAHGNRGGGALHAAATTGANGFMAAADKTKLNGIETGATADMSAAEILNAIKTVDGSGSGLDADTLRGQVITQTTQVYWGRVNQDGSSGGLPSGWTSTQVSNSYYVEAHAPGKTLFLAPVAYSLVYHVRGSTYGDGGCQVTFGDSGGTPVTAAFYFLAVLV
jgi:hypothetical protein